LNFAESASSVPSNQPKPEVLPLLFNSYPFLLIFLPGVLLGLWLFARTGFLRLSVAWTALASLVFYGFYEPRYLPLLLGSVLVNYFLGKRIIACRVATAKRTLTGVGIGLNLGVLFAYKYMGFFARTLADAGMPLPVPELLLPIGISFYTFTQISYLVDVYKEKPARYTFAEYLLFVSFFPHLVAGPILRHHLVIPQFQDSRFGRPSARVAYMGLSFFICGLFKKVMIADNLALVVSPLFSHASQLSMLQAWCAALTYTMQIYYDFSGYSEMAFGLALLLNVRIPINFNSPYRATSLIDFWRRWHISLSQFIRDYLYIPLGGSRVGQTRHFENLFVALTLCGLWHGANWTFLIWGMWHGAFLIINHLWRRAHIRLTPALGWLLTFCATVAGWVWFRAATVADGSHVLLAMLGLGGQPRDTATDLTALQFQHVWLAIAFLIPWTALAPNSRYLIIRRKPNAAIVALLAYLLLLGLLNVSNPTAFLYFKF
jgi:alginate O-acetyltransferase complex protein AlgI